MKDGGQAPAIFLPSQARPPPRPSGGPVWMPRGAPRQAPPYTVPHSWPFNYMCNCLSNVPLPAQNIHSGGQRWRVRGPRALVKE